jgi:hypothetical protein
MRQSLPRSLALLVLGFFLAAPAHAGDEKDKSPEDVFKAFAAAMKKGDAQACMSHLSRDSQSAIAGWMVMAACSERSDKTEEEACKPFEDVLKRHGISDDVRKKIRKDFWDAIGDKKNIVALGEMVKDKPAFVEDVVKVGAKYLGWQNMEFGEAKEVKIDGEQAKGQRTIPNGEGKERTETVYFKLETGVWKIDVIRMIEEPVGASPPAPSPQVQPPAAPSYSRPGVLRRFLDRLRNW